MRERATIGSADFASSMTASANLRFTFSYCTHSALRKVGRTCAMWHNGQSPSFANP